MKYWEFLIQKEGDDTWLPLETQQVEILEGRYRVVAHTDRLNTPMEIKVSQLDTSQMPPRKRVRKRTGETNDAGLVMVMPYVHLKPGQWDLSCSSVNLMGDLMGDAWQYQVQLQVFAPTDEDWSSEWPVPEDAAGAHSSVIEADTSSDAVDVSVSNSDTPLVQAQARLQDNLQRQGQTPPPEDTSLLNSVYQVSLRQQAFLARRNQSMTIMGQVRSLSDALPDQGASQLWLRLQNPETATVIMEAHRPLSLERLPADFKVKIQLPANVKTRVVLGEVSLRTAPVDGEASKLLTSTGFTITAGIAQLIDEIANRDPGTFEEEMAALSGHDSSHEELLAEQATNPEPNLISSILDPTRQAVMPAVGVVLPPQLDQSHLNHSHLDQSHLDHSIGKSAGLSDAQADYNGDQPELPNFPDAASDFDRNQPPLIVNDSPNVSPAVDPTSESMSDPASNPPDNLANADFPRRQSLVSQPAQFMGTSIEDDDLEASQIAALLEDIDGDLASQPADMASLEPPGVEGVLDAAPKTPTESPTESPISLPKSNPDFNRSTSYKSAEPAKLEQDSAQASGGSDFRTKAERQKDERTKRQTAASQAFKSLKLKDHFWQRLSNLTHESRDEAAQLAENMEAAGVSPRSDSSGSLPSFPVARQDDLPANSEVVIYDNPSTQPSSQSSSQQSAQARPASNAGGNNVSAERTAQPGASSADNKIPLSPDAATSSASGLNSLSGTPSTSGLSAAPIGESAGSPSSLARTPSLNEDLPEMELPVISVPRGDFVAGDTVTVIVRTRPSVYKPFIKLWMIDRQSRTLVGEPKLLTNLKPDALGYLESSADLRVPMGCLDVQIAAIAVDMATQQESNKAIVNRHVVPANQSSPPLRNFNL
ncbi:MAG: hypothetical protein AAFQ63_07440 [Cyanobacteria bacterium J06621_11]